MYRALIVEDEDLMREYLETVFHDPDFVSDLIDSGDGVLVSKRIH